MTIPTRTNLKNDNSDKDNSENSNADKKGN